MVCRVKPLLVYLLLFSAFASNSWGASIKPSTKPRSLPKPSPQCVIPDIPAAKPIPTGPDSATNKAFKEQLKKFYERTIVEAYKKRGVHDPKWDDAAISFLQAYVLVSLGEDSVSNIATVDEGSRKLAELGCSDPLVLSCRGMLASENGRFQEARPLLEQALEGLRTRNYPSCRILCMLPVLTRVLKELKDPAASKKEAEYQDLAISLFVQSFRDGSFRRGEQRIAIYIYNRVLADFLSAKWKQLYEKLKNLPGASDYVAKVIAGHHHIMDGWKARGTGFAYTVTEEGWKIFGENLDEAAKLLYSAWKAHPEFPEAATYMILVAMAGHAEPPETPRLWFDRAVAAQMDYMPAYKNLLNALRPVWTGSWDEMYEFGVEAAKTKRYDTEVPIFFLTVLRTMERESRRDDCWKKPETWQLLSTVLDGYASASKKPEDKKQWLTMKAIVAWKTGEYAQATQLFKELGGDLPVEPFNFIGVTQEQVVFESKIYGSKCADDLRRAEELYKQGSLTEALEIYQAVGNTCKDERDILEYISEKRKAIEVYSKLSKGDWLPLCPPADFSEWSLSGGDWKVTGDCVVTLTPREDMQRSLLSFTGEFGTRLEITGSLEFVEEAEGAEVLEKISPNMQVGAGISLQLDKPLVFLFCPGRRQAMIAEDYYSFSRATVVETDFSSKISFRITYWDGQARVEIESAQRKTSLAHVFYAGDKPTSAKSVALFGTNLAGYASVKFSDLKVRALANKP